MNSDPAPSSTTPDAPGPGPTSPATAEDASRWAALDRRRWLEPLLAAVLLVFFATCSLRFAWTTSPVFDEPFFFHAGYANLTKGAPKAATANLIFAQNWIALPLLFSRPTLPSVEELAAVDPMNREIGRLFVFHPKNDWRAMIDAGRTMNVLLGLALCVLIWRWSRSLFGPRGGLVSLAFCCLSPLIISNSAVATTDIAVTFWFAVALHRVWKLLHGVSPVNVIACGAAAGFLLVTKVSSVLLGPIAVILLAFRVAMKRPLDVGWTQRSARAVTGPVRQLAWLLPAAGAAVVIAVGVVWLCYAPQMTIFAYPAEAFPWKELAARPGGALSALAQKFNAWHLFPEAYLFDLRLFEATTTIRRGYLMGEYSLGGWWYFFPLAWWFKTPIPFMIALLVGAGVLLGRRIARSLHPELVPETAGVHALYELTPLALFGVVYMAGTLSSGLNIGVRHILPLYPALFILAGAAALGPWPQWRGRLVAGLLAWSAVEVVAVAPDFLAYCNTFAGGTSNGHKMLVDSSYEWGQDLPAVERWLAERAARPGAKPKVFFSYFGNADLSRFKIDAVLLPQFYDLRQVRPYPLHGGTYIVSATMLHSLYTFAMGPWRTGSEKAYQEMTAELRRLESLMSDPAKYNALILREGEDVWVQKIRAYDHLRFARLCAYLRKRQPDARITAGMLVYELPDDEIERALLGPPAELRLDYQISGTEKIPQSDLDFLK